MLCNDIYLSALALLGESGDNPGCSDYKSRAPLLLRLIASKLSAASALMGKAVSDASLTLESEFPAAKALAPAAAYMLASMLIFDELPSLSEVLEKAAQAELLRAGSETPAPDIGKTKEVYGL